MAGFSAADAAFTGFRVVWERPLAVAIWAAVQFVVALALNLFVAASSGSAFTDLLKAFMTGSDPAVFAARAQTVAPTLVAMLIAELVFVAVFLGAMNRVVLRPAEARFGYLRLGPDELRQLGLASLLVGLIFGLYAILFAVATIIAVIVAAATGNSVMAAALTLALILPAAACLFIYVAVRLSLSSPSTFASGRIQIRASWDLTRGRFWPLFGVYLISFALRFVVSLLVLTIALLVVGVLTGGFQAALRTMQSDASTVAAILTPPQLLYLAISAIGAALSAPITMCPPAAIYQSLSGAAPAGVSRTFE